MNIVKRIFIGVAVAMIVWFLKSEVFALTVDGRYRYSDNGTSVDGSYVAAGSLISFTTPNTNHEFNFTRFFVRFSNTSFNADSTYRFEYSYNSPVINMCPTSYSISEGATIQNVSCNYSSPTVYIVMTVTFDSSVSYVTLGSVYNYVLDINTTYNFRLLTDYLITPIDSTYEAITNNTTVISNAMDGISNILNSIYDQQAEQVGFSQALLSAFQSVFDNTSYYTNTSYSYSSTYVDGYSQAHTSSTSAGGSGLGANGSGGLGFDTSSYSSPSSSIWDFLYRLLNSNAQVFTYLTSILTLGFVKVVLNR